MKSIAISSAEIPIAGPPFGLAIRLSSGKGRGMPPYVALSLQQFVSGPVMWRHLLSSKALTYPLFADNYPLKAIFIKRLRGIQEYSPAKRLNATELQFRNRLIISLFKTLLYGRRINAFGQDLTSRVS